jgi:DNA-binding transcriptional regulator YhcF (GntR family)
MPKKLPKLSFKSLHGRAEQIVTRLTNAIAFRDRDCCDVDDLAAQFKTTPARLKQTLHRLEDAGLIKVEGEIAQQVVPTKRLLRQQDRKLSEGRASKLVRQYKRGRYS